LISIKAAPAAPDQVFRKEGAMRHNGARGAAFGLAAIGAWPVIACAALHATHTELPADAWCGPAPHSAEILGHCPACWAGAALALLAILAWRRSVLALQPFVLEQVQAPRHG
jgi:hypothetical protein